MEVRPDTTWNIGDVIDGQRRHRKENGWQITSTCDSLHPIATHVEQVLANFNAQRWNDARHVDVNTRLSCYIYCVERPMICLPASVVRAMAEFGVNLDIEVFMLESHVVLEQMKL